MIKGRTYLNLNLGGLQIRSEQKRNSCKGAKVLMLGITFKENCPDIRNTKAIDIYNELCEYDIEVDVFDPWANPEDVKHEYGIKIITAGTQRR